MRRGRQVAVRGALLDLATLVGVSLFGGATEEDIETYLRTGHLDVTSMADSDTIPYDADAMREAVRQAGGRLGKLRD